MATVGLRDLYMAEVLEDEAGAETFKEPEPLAEIIKADMSVESAEGVLYADDAVSETLKEFTKGTLKLNVKDLDPKKIAQLLGHKISNDGVIYAGGDDAAPYVAIGFRAKKIRGGIYRYVWLYKVKFKIPSENFETKNNGFNIITPEIEGEFVKLKKNDMWKADYTGLPTDEIAANWFKEVREYAESAV